MEKRTIRCQVFCQRGKRIHAEISPDTGVYEGDGIRIEAAEERINGCRCGKFRLNMRNESCQGNLNLQMEHPIRLYIPMAEGPEKITAMYLYNDWWTRPAFVEHLKEIPDRTQAVFFRYKDRVSCMVMMAGRKFKTWMTAGTKDEICLEMTACLGGLRRVDEPLYFAAEAVTPEEAVHKVFREIAEYKGIRMREERRIPEMFRYLGWCSWDAFYREVSEDKIRQKAAELFEKNVPVKWMLVDDGWLSRQEKLLCSFVPDRTKFPNGFREMTEDIKEKTGVRWFGVWHALGGYWGGIAPGSVLDLEERPYLYRTVTGKIFPSPQTGERFYRDWYQRLKSDGIDFVKVDGQSAVPYYFENNLPVCEAAEGLSQALEGGASYMDGAVINCMGMAMENILARPSSALSRNSDDFIPDKEDGFAEHLLQNAYNALYHNELYCCDWDMFWTRHKDCRKHSLLRAVSGGPVYVSDPIGATDPEVLRPLAYEDGRLLMMDRAAKPTKDCVFSDPMTDGVLKLHNTAAWGACEKGGGIAVYNLTKREQPFAFRPADIPELKVTDRYWVFDYFERKAVSLGREERFEGRMEADGSAWFVVLPQNRRSACLGLLDKYAGFMAVESICEQETAETIVIRESGPLGWLAGEEPEEVRIDSVDVTEKVQKEGAFYQISLPEGASKRVLSIIWKRPAEACF